MAEAMIIDDRYPRLIARISVYLAASFLLVSGCASSVGSDSGCQRDASRAAGCSNRMVDALQ